MEVLLSALNASFVHSSLALRYLRSYCEDEFKIEISEYTINQHSDDIAAEIYKANPDVLGFSCYIWNIDKTLDIIKILKKVKPELTIILGGPEVSYNPVKLMEAYAEIDYIIYGEGEYSFKELLTSLRYKKSFNNVKGLVYRQEDKIIKNEPQPVIDDLDIIRSPYNQIGGLENKIAYFEASRGCPFNCQYCLSSTLSSVRNLSLKRVKTELLRLINAKVKQVKFVDRTFNCNSKRTWEIFKFLLDNKPDDHEINFHFEIAADLLSDEMIEWLKQVPTGYFQFEIGVQSTKPATLDIIQRQMDFNRIKKVVNELLEAENIHLHLDLIAGLPREDYERFKESFNDVYQLKPHKLQLGFLKLLQGSGLRKNAEEYGYLFTEQPPYEVLANNDISYDQILNLKMVEEVLETFGNAHYFDHSLEFIYQNFYDSYFELYYDLASFWEEGEYYRYSHKLIFLYQVLQKFYQQHCQAKQKLFNEVLKFDYLLGRRRVNNLPDFLTRYRIENYKTRFRDFTNNPKEIKKYFVELNQLSSRQLRKEIQIETFAYDIIEAIKEPTKELKKGQTNILFNYHNKEGLFNKAQFKKVEI